MTTIAVFPSVLGVRPGVHAAVARLTEAGHEVRLVDLVGEVFDDYPEAIAVFEAPGFLARAAAAVAATADLPDGSAVLGWSAGAGLAQAAAMAHPQVSRAVLLAGAGDPAWFEGSWRPGLAAQAHSTVDDPWREQESLDALTAVARSTGATLEAFDYPGRGHLFDDASKVDEFQPTEAALLWERVLAFLA